MTTSIRENPPALRSVDTGEARPIHIPAHGNGVLHPFQPGQSGNPTGKGGLYQEAQRICREASPAAARRMVELMASTDERVALMAAEKVMERAWGRPKEMPDESEVDPEREAQKQALRAKIIRSLDELAARLSANATWEDGKEGMCGHAEIPHRARQSNPPAPEDWPR